MWTVGEALAWTSPIFSASARHPSTCATYRLKSWRVPRDSRNEVSKWAGRASRRCRTFPRTPFSLPPQSLSTFQLTTRYSATHSRKYLELKNEERRETLRGAQRSHDIHGVRLGLDESSRSFKSVPRPCCSVNARSQIQKMELWRMYRVYTPLPQAWVSTSPSHSRRQCRGIDSAIRTIMTAVWKSSIRLRNMALDTEILDCYSARTTFSSVSQTQDQDLLGLPGSRTVHLDAFTLVTRWGNLPGPEVERTTRSDKIVMSWSTLELGPFISLFVGLQKLEITIARPDCDTTSHLPKSRSARSDSVVPSSLENTSITPSPDANTH
ncbi:hypothetical protein B0T14DRAFT_151671 [Immersiella caudata]|uniref:Uncharacterized protein n=1 Tax=Immersiella caudata TaxID=314043 RepID=A0AA39WW29_9PEZI|nr:hypothetical protein B0T14DRAFT_151671 [Immersiella caudata]